MHASNSVRPSFPEPTFAGKIGKRAARMIGIPEGTPVRFARHPKNPAVAVDVRAIDFAADVERTGPTSMNVSRHTPVERWLTDYVTIGDGSIEPSNDKDLLEIVAGFVAGYYPLPV